MKWTELNSAQQLEQLKTDKGYSIIFKHSTRCSVSLFAKRRFEKEWDELPIGTPVYYLDLLNQRELSALIAETFKVHHESPQMILLKDGACVYESSHGDITVEDVAAQMKQLI